MNEQQAARWKSEVLDLVFESLAAEPALHDVLIFKGARVLNLRLGGGRQSLDIDSNLNIAFVDENPARPKQQEFLESVIGKGVHRYFDGMNPIRYSLSGIRVRPNPKNSHPSGWNGFEVRLSIRDLRQTASSLPAVEIDIAAPEKLRPNSVAQLTIGHHQVLAYTLERIAGEKLRAFLSSLPEYRKKLFKRSDAVRVKDLFDIVRIHEVHGLENVEFWNHVGQEFVVACESRFIDCAGKATFHQDWDVTRSTYRQSPFAQETSFERIEDVLDQVIDFLSAAKLIPFFFPLPPATSPP
jgi:hypothetical protein